MNNDILSERIEGRRSGEEMAQFVRDTADNLTSDESRAAFWRAVKAAIDQDIPPAPPLQPARFTPMTDTEAMVFGATVIPFGKHRGQSIDNVPLAYLV